MTRSVVAPIAGRLIARLVREGDSVTADTEVAIVEAMKMHIPVNADRPGRVARWLVAEASVIAEGDALLVLED